MAHELTPTLAFHQRTPRRATLTVSGLLGCILGAFMVLLVTKSPGFTNILPQFNSLRTVLLLLFYFIFILLGMFYLRRSDYRLSAVEWIWVGFLAYIVVSSLWSIYPNRAFPKSAALIFAMSSAFVVSRLVDDLKFLKIVFGTFAVMLVVSLATAAFVPVIGIHDDHALRGSWRGINGHKNHLGMMASYLMVLIFWMWLYPGVARRVSRLSRSSLVLFGLMALALFAHVMSVSRGAMLFLMVAVPMLFLLRFQRAGLLVYMTIVVFYVMVTVGISSGSLYVYDDIIHLFGADISTSRRIDIWVFGFVNTSGSWLFGTGVEGFWTPNNAMLFESMMGWDTTNLHSGYVTLLVELGAMGGLLFFMVVVFVFATGLKLKAIDPEFFVHATLALLVGFVFHNLIEDTLIRSTDTYLFTTSVLIFKLGRRQRRLKENASAS